MQTARDQEIVGWIARLGAAGAEHVQARFGMGRSQAYSRLSALTREGLLEQKRLLHRTPGLHVASCEGLRRT
ncbi:MAG TPA: helix-turn-helix domain-containing protein [Solirubrobacteraceae bacterium]|nr:helix-turn-helix domain-containing protein [Solirubrobacteraceae bacterium]